MVKISSDLTAEKRYVKAFIVSGCTMKTTTDPKKTPEQEFEENMGTASEAVKNELVNYCDQLRNNFIQVHGPDAPGIRDCDKAIEMIRDAKGPR